MTDPVDLSGFSLYDLFRAEVVSHAAAIDEALLALEASPADAARLEGLMRAAHSMKGAARILGVDPVVRVAHAMEDAFVAAQRGKVALLPAVVDVLLAGNDFLKEVARRTEAECGSFLAAQVARIDVLVARTRAVAEGDASPSPAPTAKATPTAQAPATTSHAPDEGAAVRVSAAGLGRMLAYAGETLVEARRLGAATASLEGVRRIAAQLSAIADSLPGGGEPAPHSLEALRELASESRHRIAAYVETLEVAARRGEDLAGRLYHEVLASRMRPFGDVTSGFPRLVRDLARDLEKRVRFVLEGRDVLVDRDVLDRLDAPINHLLRNSLDHGMESPSDRQAAGKDPEGRVRVEARHRAGMLEIEVVDDGRGVDFESLRLRVVEQGLIAAPIARSLDRSELLEFLFLPGFSTREGVTEISGRGVGLDVVHTMAREMGGSVRAESETGHGIRFVLTLPITRSVLHCAVVRIAGDSYALPLVRIERSLSVDPEEIGSAEGREHFPFEGRPVGLVPAAEVLGLAAVPRPPGPISVVLLASGDHRYGLAVDDVLGERDLLVRPLDPRLGKVANVASVAVDEAGDPVLILDVEDLVRSIDALLHEGRMRTIRVRAPRAGTEGRRRKRVLVVDDSITVREVERGLLSAAGYLVDVAVDGMDAWNALKAGDYDLVVSDVDMPRLNGIDLVRRIRQDQRLERLPVMIVSYKDRDEDRRSGLEAGANAYVTKGAFQEDTWISRVVDLIGEPEEDARP